MKYKCLAGSQEETNNESGYHKAIYNKSASFHGPPQLKYDRPIQRWQSLDDEKVVENKWACLFNLRLQSIKVMHTVHISCCVDKEWQW